MTWANVLSVVSTVAAIFFGYLAFRRNQKDDDQETGEKSGSVFTELGWIKKGVGDIERELKEGRVTTTKVLDRLGKVETAVEYQDKRIEKLERKENEHG